MGLGEAVLELDAHVALLERAHEQFSAAGDDWGVGAVNIALAKNAHSHADPDELRRYAEAGARAFARTGDRQPQAPAPLAPQGPKPQAPAPAASNTRVAGEKPTFAMLSRATFRTASGVQLKALCSCV